MKHSDDTSYRRNSPKIFTSAVVVAVVVAVAILTVLLSSRPVATANEPVDVSFGACFQSAGGSLEVLPGADINVWGGWGAHKRGLIAAYLSAVDQSLSVNGTPIANANDLYGPVVGDRDSGFATYWNLALDPLEPGQTYVIDQSLGLTHPIIDGGDYNGDGRPDLLGPGENLWNFTCTLWTATAP